MLTVYTDAKNDFTKPFSKTKKKKKDKNRRKSEFVEIAICLPLACVVLPKGWY